MAKVTLGLDVGPSSLGWALISEQQEKIIASGVRVFPEGVDRDQQGGEQSKSQSRREARGMRRQIQRRAHRRRLMRRSLMQVGLLPKDPHELEKLLKTNPYELRANALEQKLELYELGRVFLHLAQRRGYLSNRKTDKAKDKDTKGMLGEINELAGTLQNSASTLGGYFAQLDRNYKRCEANSDRHIRGKHTKREMYLDEFEAIWSAQQKFYPQILADVLKYGRKGKQLFPKEPEPLNKDTDPLTEYGIYGLLFFQRKMYWPKSVVGRCELEPREKRCPRATRIAQRFRMVQEVNNLMLLDRTTGEYRSLSQAEREKLLGILSEKKEMTFDDIRKKLDMGDTIRFNFESGGRKKLDGHKTDAVLSGTKALGKSWKKLPDDIKDVVVDILIKEDQDADAIEKLMGTCNLTEEEAQRAVSVPLPDGYMSFSRLAINNLLPYMEKGFMLMDQNIANSAIHAAGYLRPDEREINQHRFLPLPPQFTNPLVRQAMYEVRKTVNSILRELVYRQEHELTHIHVELAREAKKSFDERTEIRFDNIEKQKMRANAAKAIEEFDASIKPSRNTINRYLLWREQGEDCPYCGKKISIGQLFNGDADVDHILPRWRSLDDSMANKVIAHRSCNQEKGDHTPCEWLAESDPERYHKVLLIASKLPFGKQRKFQQTELVLDDFVNRQLTDTAYITRCVSQYLQCLGADIICTRGQMTSDLRYYWGLNTILNPEGEGEKNREDHRHHAVDALVIGLTDSKRLFALANDRGKNIQPPWPGFREDSEKIIKEIKVSHRPLRKLRGALHQETFYGRTQKIDSDKCKKPEDRPWVNGWIEDQNKFVRRKSIESLTKTQDLEKVRDPMIREILRSHLRDQNIDPDKPGKISGDAFKGKNIPKMPSGVLIKRIRMVENSDMMQSVSDRRNYQFVEPGSNHHVVIYRLFDEQDKPILNSNGTHKQEGVVVTMFETAKRITENKPLIDRGDKKDGKVIKKFAMSLSINEMFLLEMPEGPPMLHRIQKISEGGIILRPHTYAGKVSDYDKPPIIQRKSPNTLKGQKVTIDRLGRIRSAND